MPQPKIQRLAFTCPHCAFEIYGVVEHPLVCPKCKAAYRVSIVELKEPDLSPEELLLQGNWSPEERKRKLAILNPEKYGKLAEKKDTKDAVKS